MGESVVFLLFFWLITVLLFLFRREFRWFHKLLVVLVFLIFLGFFYQEVSSAIAIILESKWYQFSDQLFYLINTLFLFQFFYWPMALFFVFFMGNIKDAKVLIYFSLIFSMLIIIVYFVINFSSIFSNSLTSIN